MRPASTTRGLRKRVATMGVCAVAAASAFVVLPAGIARADVGSVSALTNPTPDTYAKTTEPDKAQFQVTVNSPVAFANVKYVVTAGPNKGSILGFGNVHGDCTTDSGSNPVAPYTVVDSTHPLCSFAQSKSPLSGGTGVDTVLIYADKNNNGSADSSEPSVTVHATWVGAPATVALSGTSPVSAQSYSCIADTASAKDGSGQPVPRQNLKIRITQQSDSDTSPITFCAPAPAGTPVVTSTGTHVVSVVATVTTGTNGDPAPFSFSTTRTDPITLQTFYDPNDNNVIDKGEPVASRTINLVAGGADGVRAVGITMSPPSVFTGETVTGTILLANSNGVGISGVTPSVTISGPNATPVAPSASDSSGKSFFSYTPSNTGTDTITTFVNQTSGGTPGKDPSEPSASATETVSGVPTNTQIATTVLGSIAGGSTATAAGAQDAGDSQHGIIPVTQASDVFTAVVTDSSLSNHPARSGVTVRFTIPARHSGTGTSANDATLNTTTAVTDANGVAKATLTNPNPVAGDAFRVLATVAGTTNSSPSWLLQETSSITPTSDPTNNSLGTTFPTVHGSVFVAPPLSTTQVGTSQSFTAAVRDQFAALKPGVSLSFTVSGRNSPAPQARTTDSNGAASASFTDTSTAPTSAAPLDTVKVLADQDGNAATTSDQTTGTALRYYTENAPIASAASGGTGGPSTQFAATSPYAAVTSDDAGTGAIDVTHALADMTPVNVFFAARNSDNSSPLYGRTFSITTDGVGALVSGPDNKVLTGAQTVAIATNGFAQISALSTRTGTQTITATIDAVTTQVLITWTNSGAQRNITLTPAATNVQVNSIVSLTATATDMYGNKVPGAPITAVLTNGTGQATFADGSTTLTAATGGAGTLVLSIKGVTAGGTSVKVTMGGNETSRAANDPVTNAPAGNSTATSSVTVGALPAASSNNTTLLSNKGTSVPLNTLVTVTGTIRDASNAVIPGKTVDMSVSGVVNGTNNGLVTDSNGQVAIPVQSSSEGTATVTMTVRSSSGAAELTKVIQITFGAAPTVYPRPKLSQQNANGVVLLIFQVDKHYVGKTVYFFRRSGITGQVVPLGTATINSKGDGFRKFNAARGGILALYGKILGAPDIATPYSNDVHFKVQ